MKAKKLRWVLGAMAALLLGGTAFLLRPGEDPRDLPELQGLKRISSVPGVDIYDVAMPPGELKGRIMAWADRNGLESVSQGADTLSVLDRWGEQLLSLAPRNGMVVIDPEGRFAIAASTLRLETSGASVVTVVRERSFGERLIALKRRLLP
jgi:hypothetical protein